MAGYLPDPAGCGRLPVRRGHSGPGRSDHGRRFALAAVVDGTGLARQVAAVAGPLRLAASAVLAVVAAWMAAAAVRRYRSPASAPRVGLALRTPLRAYAALAGVTVLNPLTVVY